jgi:RecA/RadA recombinase
MAMRKRESKSKSLTEQVERSAEKKVEKKPKYDGNIEQIISTGSTLLDLEISGERIRGGGIPAGILVEVFGQNSTGKTVLLCEIAGNIQRKNGQVLFKDPEARLNKQFARLFGVDPDEIDYSTPDTVPEVFGPIQKWKPTNPDVVNGIFADSLAALSTELELEKGDKMGMRRAKEFSQECRKICRILAKNNFLMVCSNQMRATGNTFGPSEAATGGNAIPYYSCLRIKLQVRKRLDREIEFDTGRKDNKGKPVFYTTKKFYGIVVDAFIAKSSVAMPYGTAPLYILGQYGIDDVRANLAWYKQVTKSSSYFAGGRGLEEAIMIVEKENRTTELREAVIDLWEKLFRFSIKKERERIPKERW